MTGVGLFKKVPTPDDQRLDRIQQNIADAFDALAQSLGVLAIPVASLTGSAGIPAGRSVVVFAGPAGQSLTLPLARAQGNATAAIVVVVNTSGNAVTVRPSAAETLDGAASMTVAAGTFKVLVSDGIGKWFSK